MNELPIELQEPKTISVAGYTFDIELHNTRELLFLVDLNNWIAENMDTPHMKIAFEAMVSAWAYEQPYDALEYPDGELSGSVEDFKQRMLSQSDSKDD